MLVSKTSLILLYTIILLDIFKTHIQRNVSDAFVCVIQKSVAPLI